MFTSAGTSFTANVRAVLWAAADDTDNNGIADNHDDNNPANNADLSDNAAALNYGQESIVEQVSLSATLDQPAGNIRTLDVQLAFECEDPLSCTASRLRQALSMIEDCNQRMA